MSYIFRLSAYLFLFVSLNSFGAPITTTNQPVNPNEIQLNTFQNGEVADADDVNENFHALSNALSSQIPYVFSNGSVADADEINANFQALSDDISSCLNTLDNFQYDCENNGGTWNAFGKFCESAPCDITINDAAIAAANFNAGVASVDITVDNQASYDAGVASVNSQYSTCNLPIMNNDASITSNIPSSEFVSDVSQGASQPGAVNWQINIPDNISSIGSYAFYQGNVGEVNFPSSMTRIGEGAFWDNPIKSLNIPGSVEIIERLAFFQTDINSLTLGNGIKAIFSSAFRFTKLPGFNSFTLLPATLEYLGPEAFDVIHQLKLGDYNSQFSLVFNSWWPCSSIYNCESLDNSYLSTNSTGLYLQSTDIWGNNLSGNDFRSLQAPPDPYGGGIGSGPVDEEPLTTLINLNNLNQYITVSDNQVVSFAPPQSVVIFDEKAYSNGSYIGDVVSISQPMFGGDSGNGDSGFLINGSSVIGEQLELIITHDDPDGVPQSGYFVEWQYQDVNGNWEKIQGSGSTKSYSPTLSDFGYLIRAKISYDDLAGSGGFIGSGNSVTIYAEHSIPVSIEKSYLTSCLHQN